MTAHALVEWSRRRALHVLVASLLVLAATAPAAARLYGNLRTDLRELLPRGAPAAVALDAMEQRVGGYSNLMVVVETADAAAGQRFVDALAARLGSLVPGTARDVRYRIDDEVAFEEAHGALYIPLDKLRDLRDRLAQAERAAKARLNPFLFDLEEGEGDGGDGGDRGKAERDQVVEALRTLKKSTGRNDHFVGGYLAGDGGKTLVLLVTPAQASVSLTECQALLGEVRRLVDEVGPTRFHPSIRVGYGGDVTELVEVQQHLVDDLASSTLIVAITVSLVVLLFFRTSWSIPLLGAPLLVGLSVALAAGRFAIGYLNPNTAFLGSIIVGNGVNAGIILLARYFEERRRGADVATSLHVAVADTWRGTLTASGAAAASYGVLGTTGFRGFSQFAFLGSCGMTTTWLATYLVMPAAVFALERLRPGVTALGPSRSMRRWSHLYSRVMARGAVPVVVVALALTGLSAVLVATAGSFVEYDFSHLGSRHGRVDGARYWGARQEAVMQSYQTPVLVMTSDEASADAVVRAVTALKSRQGATSTIDTVISEGTLLPAGQAERLALLREVMDFAGDELLGTLPDDVAAFARRVRDKTELREVSREDLPRRWRRLLEEKDGRRGRLVLVYPTLGATAEHGEEQLALSRDLRATVKTADAGAMVAGGIILSSDIIDSILREGPRTAAFSLVGVFLLTLVVLRSLRSTSVVIGTQIVGVLWLGGCLVALALKLNFVNFVVLPITFGIGVDYGVNLYLRWRHEGTVGDGVAATAGAIALCSATTVFGYGSLVVADNEAIRWFGIAAVIGELTCLAAAILVLPALLARSRGRRRAEVPELTRRSA